MGKTRQVYHGGADTPGASYAFRRFLWEKFGPSLTLRQCEDAYLMWRAHKQGYLTVYTPRSAVYHTHGRGIFNDLGEWLTQIIIVSKIKLGYYSKRA